MRGGKPRPLSQLEGLFLVRCRPFHCKGELKVVETLFKLCIEALVAETSKGKGEKLDLGELGRKREEKRRAKEATVGG